MPITKKVPVSVFCPHSEYYQDGYAKIEKINFAGDPHDYAKMVSFSCDCSYSCNVDEDNCPLIKKGMQIRHW